MNEILKEMKEICDVWVKMDGNVISYTQNEINLIYEYIKNLEQALDEIEKYMTNYIKVEDKNENVKVEFDELLKIIQKTKGDN